MALPGWCAHLECRAVECPEPPTHLPARLEMAAPALCRVAACERPCFPGLSVLCLSNVCLLWAMLVFRTPPDLAPRRWPCILWRETQVEKLCEEQPTVLLAVRLLLSQQHSLLT